MKKKVARLKKERIEFAFLYQLAFYEISKYFTKTLGKVDLCQTFLAKGTHATWRNGKSGLGVERICSRRTLPGLTVGT